MKIAAVIPARMGSTRFPGKPLARLCGLPMIEHVYRRSKLAACLDEVYIATCDDEIADACRQFGAPAVMTSASHQRACDRAAEVAERLDADIVVMIQGDEPTITPELIEQVLQPLQEDPSVVCANIGVPIRSEAEWRDPNTIKVVTGLNGDALYFSRHAIPSGSFAQLAAKLYKQVCVIPFRRDFLLTFTRLAPTPLEIAESIDMLRALEHGYPVRIVRSDNVIQSVDTPADLVHADVLLGADPLTQSYLSKERR